MTRTVEEITENLASGMAYPRIIREDQAWYFSYSVKDHRDAHVIESWSVGVDSPSGGTFGEWEMNWRTVGGQLAMRIEAFDDGLAAMNAVPGWWDAILSCGEGAQPDDVFAALEVIGFRDETPRERGKRREVAP